MRIPAVWNFVAKELYFIIQIYGVLYVLVPTLIILYLQFYIFTTLYWYRYYRTE